MIRCSFDERIFDNLFRLTGGNIRRLELGVAMADLLPSLKWWRKFKTMIRFLGDESLRDAIESKMR